MLNTSPTAQAIPLRSTTVGRISPTALEHDYRPNGVQVAASQYDATGHLIQLTDANGKPTNFAINETSQTETVTDRTATRPPTLTMPTATSSPKPMPSAKPAATPTTPTTTSFPKPTR